MSSSDDDHDPFDASFDPSTTLPLDKYEVPLRKPGYIPSNCGEPTAVITNESSRKAYRRMTAYIAKDTDRNCCTIDEDNVLKLYKATELPVKLTKADRKTTFFYSEYLDWKH